MPGNFVTPLDVAASVDRILRRNIQWPVRNLVFADSPVTVSGVFDRSIFCDASGGAMAVNLPDATLNKGMFFEVKKTDPGVDSVTIACTIGGQTIDGVAAKVLIAQNDFIVVESDGANYKIVALVISTPGTGGAVFYSIKKIYKTDGVSTLVPVDGTTIAFTVAVDGECFFAATGLFAGFTGFDFTDLAIYVDGVLLVHSSEFILNGSGGDSTGPLTQEPCGSKFLAAGPHTAELVAAQVNLALQASVADPLTLSVLYPAASFATAAPTPKAATLVVSPVVGIGDYTTIEAALAAIAALGGGYILVREGSYVVPVGGYVLPDCPVEIVGCASDIILTPTGTSIDATAFVGGIFVKAFKHNYKIADLTIFGSGLSTQRLFDASAIADSSGWAIVENVRIKDVQNGFLTVAGSGDLLFVRMTKVIFEPSGGASKLWSSGIVSTSSGKLEANQCTVIGSAIEGNPEVTLTGSYFDCTQPGGVFTNLVATLIASSCQLFGEFQSRKLRGDAILGCAFGFGLYGIPNRFLDFIAATRPAVVDGCSFLVQGVAEEIRNAGSRLTVAACEGDGFLPKVTETGAANSNHYYDVAQTSVILGAKTMVDNGNIQPIAADVTLDETHRTVKVDASGAARTITLPPAVSAKYWKYIVKKVDGTANIVTVDADGAETIDGALTYVLMTQYQAIEIQSDGTTWLIV